MSVRRDPDFCEHETARAPCAEVFVSPASGAPRMGSLHLIGRWAVAARHFFVEQPEIDAQLGTMMNEMIQHPVAPDVVLGVVDPGLVTSHKLPV